MKIWTLPLDFHGKSASPSCYRLPRSGAPSQPLAAIGCDAGIFSPVYPLTSHR